MRPMSSAYLAPAPDRHASLRISIDEFLETLRRRVLIPVVEAGAAEVRLEVARELPPAIASRQADRLWTSAQELVASLPAGSRLHVRVSAEADETHVSISSSRATIGALLAAR